MIWIVLGIIVLLVLFAIGIYNGLITARNGYKNEFAQIDVQLTRRDSRPDPEPGRDRQGLPR